jgi:lipid II:glycine glycyltransferase (peptidoglycan interpeptide bridge formation enzyme)
MVLARRLFGLYCEEYWFDPEGFLESTADVVALRTHEEGVPAGAVVREKTLALSLDKTVDELLAAMQSRTRGYVRNTAPNVRISLARTDDDRGQFYRLYRSFAKSRGLMLPRRDEEGDLDIFLARTGSGDLLHATAFIPARKNGVYRYRYSVAAQKSQVNKAIVWTALLHAKNAGFHVFDFGGIPADLSGKSPLHDIYLFKAQFGGTPKETFFYLRSDKLWLKPLVACIGGIISHQNWYALAVLAANKIGLGRWEKM